MFGLEELRREWKHPVTDRAANTAVWDEAAESFCKHAVPKWEDNPFLQEIEKKVKLYPGMRVLDIGCGTGIYSMAMASRAKEIIGVDLSPKMIAYARKKADDAGIENVDFRCMDWPGAAEEEIEKLGKFDLVFAHMTPAVADADSFFKMLRTASAHCFLVKPVRRSDSVLDKVKLAAGVENRPDSFDKGMLYAFGILWQRGLLPELSYRKETWESERDLEDAKKWYINKIRTYNPLEYEGEAKICRLLETLQENGTVKETVNTAISTMYWNMEETVDENYDSVLQ
ncbi:class I SAM-dependent methyltransferase [Qiania dongpingensis]|uniref:Methyltransferase domain-containing protein n=1 Tax=Qiania dongpingensis TaxID=2763669 RepID=A0A7G9G2L9_9FIRM|nr:class I SAM-dependent methyltransferase [Qiania dongpingensis]QNM05051.1 methyltransferase domain-containing protein [Qiania dongpingensis]